VVGEFSLALLDFNKLIRLKPDDEQGYFYRGVIYANLSAVPNTAQATMGILDKAITDFKKGLKLKLGDANITDSLAKAKKKQAAYKMQERLKKEARTADRVQTKVRNQAGELEAEINQLRSEVKMFKELVLEIILPKPKYSIPLTLNTGDSISG
jgi:tetratricopeptide (TPR) repeat protein